MMKEFLQQVNSIIVANKAIMEENRRRGYSFNIFNIIGMKSDEVRLHSAFLAELLNPNGNHGMGEAFLQSFVTMIVKDNDFTFSLQGCRKVEVEKAIGHVTDTDGGRLDILLHNADNHAILIENKIYAGDQENQLLRYHNYAKSKFTAHKLLYLTLDGREASDASTAKQIFDYSTVSYRDDILQWLGECARLAYNKPLVRETIVQYTELIRQLTNQTMENDKTIELFDLMNNNIDSVLGIANAMEGWKSALWGKLYEQLKAPAPLAINKQELKTQRWDKRPGVLFCKDAWQFHDEHFCISIQQEDVGLLISIKKKDLTPPKCQFEGIQPIFNGKLTPYSRLGCERLEYENNGEWHKYRWLDAYTAKAVLNGDLARKINSMIAEKAPEIDKVFAELNKG